MNASGDLQEFALDGTFLGTFSTFNDDFFVVSTIPEPGALSVVAVGGLILLITRRRRTG